MRTFRTVAHDEEDAEEADRETVEDSMTLAEMVLGNRHTGTREDQAIAEAQYMSDCIASALAKIRDLLPPP